MDFGFVVRGVRLVVLEGIPLILRQNCMNFCR